MTQVTLNNGDTGLAFRNALNGNFTELYTYKFNTTDFNATFDTRFATSFNGPFDVRFSSSFNPAFDTRFGTSFNAPFDVRFNSSFNSAFDTRLNTSLKPTLDAQQTSNVKADIVAATYTLALTDGSGYLKMNSGTSQTITIPSNSSIPFSIGTTISFVQKGAGAFTIAPGAGVTLNHMATNGLTSAGQFGVVQVIKEAVDTWTVFGALA